MHLMRRTDDHSIERHTIEHLAPVSEALGDLQGLLGHGQAFWITATDSHNVSFACGPNLWYVDGRSIQTDTDDTNTDLATRHCSFSLFFRFPTRQFFPGSQVSCPLGMIPAYRGFSRQSIGTTGEFQAVPKAKRLKSMQRLMERVEFPGLDV
jgi:hypothetical protein